MNCQRWTNGRHTWKHTSDGGFNPLRYDVSVVPDATARAYVIRNHYSHQHPAAKVSYGLHEGEALVGVAVLSIPVQRSVLTNVFPGLEPYEESVELGRFVLEDAVPANAESWFLARCWELALRQGIRGVVSFSDPVPRKDAEGQLVMPGHVGTIYQATNAAYLGRATPRTLRLLPDGTVLNARAMQKIRAQEPGHEYVERQLHAAGAPPRKEGEDGTAWLRRVLPGSTTTVRHRGNHRYAFALGKRKATITGERMGYPKQRD
jgi:hypothetical protein